MLDQVSFKGFKKDNDRLKMQLKSKGLLYENFIVSQMKIGGDQEVDKMLSKNPKEFWIQYSSKLDEPNLKIIDENIYIPPVLKIDRLIDVEK